MNTSFWRPFLILALAVLLITFVAWLIPSWDNEVFAIKNIDWLQELLDSSKPPKPDSLELLAKESPATNETGPLNGFTGKLAQLKKEGRGNVRVAHFGDSIIEGDLITSQLRELLQKNYGGNGVGLVPITSIVSDFRMTIRHSFSRNWQTRSFANRGSFDVPLGMIGYTFIPKDYYLAESVVEIAPPVAADTLAADSLASPAPATKARKETRRFYVSGPSWVEYSGTGNPGGVSEFRRIRLFYSHAMAQTGIKVIYDGKDVRTFPLENSEGLQVLDLSPAAPVKKIRLEFDPLHPVHVYGVSFDDTDGIYVDNFAVRGYSGMYFHALPQENIIGFQEHLDYDLIILQYGMNVSNPETRDFKHYKAMMTRTIRFIQAALPEVPILIVSVHDRSIKQKGEFQTSPDIPLLVQTQAEIACETGCAFWNLYAAMGGLNSMPEYVKAKPPLANTDYLHFTLAGANKIAGMLYKVITTGETN